MTWPFGDLPSLAYEVIMADPPWAFELRSEKGEAKSAQAQYACMPLDDIMALPVGHLARGDAWLLLWATYPMLPQALKVMEAWGFEYVTAGSWVKRGKSGKLSFGTGYVLRSCAELFLLGRVGNPPTFSKSVRNILEAPRREHSRKPDAAYSMAEQLFGPARRLDLFSRESRPGWDTFGFETGKFDEVAA
jgi:N6-adenosine-specific RNA methylase IME4